MVFELSLKTITEYRKEPIRENMEAIKTAIAAGVSYSSLSNAPVAKPTCPWGKTPRLFLTPASVYADGTTLRLTGITVSALDNGNQWYVFMVINGDDERDRRTASGSVLATTACQ
jgi:hypothetical protein